MGAVTNYASRLVVVLVMPLLLFVIVGVLVDRQPRLFTTEELHTIALNARGTFYVIATILYSYIKT